MEEDNSLQINSNVGNVLDTRYDTENLLIEHAYKLNDIPDVSIQNIKRLDRKELIAGLIEKSNADWEPSLQELETLTCVLVRDKASAWKSYVERQPILRLR